MLITSEYSTGAIRTSITAVPRRPRFLSAKAVIVAVTFVVAEVSTFAALFIGQVVISGHAPTANLGQPGVLRALIGCGFYGALIGLLGLALGALVRHPAGAIAVLVALLLVLPGISAALPSSMEHTVEKFWPTQAGQQVTQVVPTAHNLSPCAGLAIMALFVTGRASRRVLLAQPTRRLTPQHHRVLAHQGGPRPATAPPTRAVPRCHH